MQCIEKCVLHAYFLFCPFMTRNKLHYSFLLNLTIIGSLFLLSFMQEWNVGFTRLKRIDLLSDIHPDQADSITTDTTHMEENVALEVEDSIQEKQDSIIHEVVEHCKPGLTCIEDYSGNNSAMKSFLDALNRTEVNDRKLRIAFYGDSFIEGDVFCGSVRDSLQSVFGGRGVGFVPITSNVTGFRNTIKHNFGNWRTYSLINKNGSSVAIGPSGFTFLPEENNWVEYRVSKQRFLNEFNSVSIFYRNLSASTVLQLTVDTTQSLEPLAVSNDIRELSTDLNKVKKVRFEVYPSDSVSVYGASFETRGGISVDNFSIRGNSGLNLSSIDAELHSEFAKLRSYKLVILQFGLNLVVAEKLNYEAYVSRMVGVINNLKKVFPDCSFLLLGISDHSVNDNGTYKTMPSITVMRDAQRLIAQQTGIAFWDTFSAMGGEGSMVKWTEAKPPLGARDYTHLTFKGGRKLAGALVKSLLYEKSKYARQ
jgi:lysophospholipase L1-like esterase